MKTYRNNVLASQYHCHQKYQATFFRIIYFSPLFCNRSNAIPTHTHNFYHQKIRRKILSFLFEPHYNIPCGLWTVEKVISACVGLALTPTQKFYVYLRLGRNLVLFSRLNNTNDNDDDYKKRKTHYLLYVWKCYKFVVSIHETTSITRDSKPIDRMTLLFIVPCFHKIKYLIFVSCNKLIVESCQQGSCRLIFSD